MAGHRKSPKRVAAGKKAARTKAMKHAKRVAAGKKAAKTRASRSRSRSPKRTRTMGRKRLPTREVNVIMPGAPQNDSATGYKYVAYRTSVHHNFDKPLTTATVGVKGYGIMNRKLQGVGSGAVLYINDHRVGAVGASPSVMSILKKAHKYAQDNHIKFHGVIYYIPKLNKLMIEGY